MEKERIRKEKELEELYKMKNEENELKLRQQKELEEKLKLEKEQKEAKIRK